MTELELFRDHCRKMSSARHTPECSLPRPGFWLDIKPNPKCPGCVSDADRALFARLAAEVDAYLTTDEPEGLFA